MLSLPSPGAVPSLNDDVYTRLRRKFPSELPSRPLNEPGSDCRTCNGTLSFRWLADLSRAVVPERVEVPRPRRPGEVDVTYVLAEEPETAEYACECWRQARLQAYLLAHNVGKTGARASWADATWVPQSLLDPLRDYAAHCTDWASRGLGLFLYGLYGSGKSLVSTMILKAFLKQGVEGHWITFNQMLNMHMDSWRDREEREWFETRVRNAQVLVIDDLGKETSFQPPGPDGVPLGNNWSSLVSRALDTTFRTRVQNGMVTIITANMSPDDVALNYTPALGSLAVEACLPYQFPPRDLRRLYVERIKHEARLGLTRPFVLD